MSVSRPLTILIAEDSKPVVEMLTELLAGAGRIEVVGVADSGSAVYESIRRLKPDVVVLDLQSKAGSGTDVIRAVRANEALRTTHIIVISSHASPQIRAGCLGLGANEYYDKVKELPTLAAKLGELAAAKGSR